MPVAQFPGDRNWGYDGVYPYAVQNSYGGPAGLKRLVNACHAQGLAVVLDVVYNHLGPEGNYASEFGSTSRTCTKRRGARRSISSRNTATKCAAISSITRCNGLTDFHIDGAAPGRDSRHCRSFGAAFP